MKTGTGIDEKTAGYQKKNGGWKYWGDDADDTYTDKYQSQNDIQILLSSFHFNAADSVWNMSCSFPEYLKSHGVDFLLHIHDSRIFRHFFVFILQGVQVIFNTIFPEWGPRITATWAS